MTEEVLKAAFPWFGGKSRAAKLIWTRFGNVPNYVEPFAGSLAVLLRRPHEDPKAETVNDIDCYVANFWRAIMADPGAVAQWADFPINEADLHARHQWLVNRTEFREKMRSDPDFHDVKIAGWWVWGLCMWIGGGWCKVMESVEKRRPALQHENGVHTWRKRPVLQKGGFGVHRRNLPQQLPAIGGDGSGSGRGVLRWERAEHLQEWFECLATRLRRVRVCCGDWSRVLTRTPTIYIGTTAVLLDPPYGAAADREADIYAHDDLQVAGLVREWAIENGENDKFRIALCGYDGEHDMPDDWECVAWKANGGYGNQYAGRGRANAGRERIWFSPHCVKPEGDLFG
jgi:site-specific DNA-adenine methylase